MQRNFWQVVLASAFGAFVGGTVALEIAEHFQYGSYFWGLGAILGGLVGYVGVDFADFREGVRLAYRRTIAWQPYWPLWKTNLLCSISVLTASSNFIVLIGLLGDWKTGLWVFGAITCPVLFAIFFMVVLEEYTGESSKDQHTLDCLRGDDEVSKKILLYANPFAVWFYWLPKCVWWAVAYSPAGAVWVILVSTRAAHTLGRFASTTFLYVHTQKRTICFAAAALGAAIGYHAGSALVGAAAGALIGSVEYQLVAVRWLKVVPNGQRA